ncbi:1-acyl-sn-glycerol-3-phosphate acyltransferase [Lewinella sp. 4G2]|uniref:1-acyl-sn-glycerol-3-phosphate acyltransferase n=1 Tax=Lewinella sp. 4G2 TaxID=1803372 RepID=UPI0007B49A26|nr:1-acyl-sn-glycerol-3-phosphate acyltransferase [Lewinella sp. 4G2]OAV45510.1 hypothetical protein A3850_013875 [Lewinella sp. 4G2]
MGLLYQVVKPVAGYVLRRFYRNIDITGLEHIPRKGAVILAANHPTAFIEPCLLACFQPRQLHFLARGDLYKNKLATFALRTLNILPVYRIQDGGFGKLRNNFETFDDCFRVLGDGKAIMILAEGSCVHEKKLRPLRKGTARIALGALEADPTLSEVHIVPVGVNFTAPDRLRSTVMIRCGEPIKASKWLQDYLSNPTPALTNLTRHLRQRLSPLVVQHPSDVAVPAAELALEIIRTQVPELTGLSHDGRQLAAELETAKRSLPTELLNKLAAQLRHHGVSMDAVAGAKQGASNNRQLNRPGNHWHKLGFFWVLQIPLLPIHWIADYIATNKVNHVEFHQPVRFAATAIGLVVLIPLFLIILPPIGKAWTIVAILTWKFYQRMYDREQGHHEQKRVHRLVKADQKKLRDVYQEVLRELDFPQSVE